MTAIKRKESPSRAGTIFWALNPRHVTVVGFVLTLFVLKQGKRAPLAAQLNVVTASRSTSTTSTPIPPAQNKPDLRFEDLRITGFLGGGSEAFVFDVVLPPWYLDAHNFNHSKPFVMKVMDAEVGVGDPSSRDVHLVDKIAPNPPLFSAKREFEAFQILNNADPVYARKIGILPLIFSATDMPNPFRYDASLGIDLKATAMPSGHRHELRKNIRKIDVEVIPRAEKDLLFDKARTMEEHITLFRSLLVQLDYAHKQGVNLNDIHPEKNFFVREDGGAALFDWNAYIRVGEKTYQNNRGLHLSPPEGMARKVHGEDIRLYQIHSVDVWQLGLLWARVLYYPCVWASDRLLGRQNLLRETILAIGGNVIAPKNETHDIDLASLVGLSSDDVAQIEFKPLLSSKSKGSHHCYTKSRYLEDPNVPQEKKDLALDLLKSMLKISAYDRPTCEKLLRHPFLN